MQGLKIDDIFTTLSLYLGSAYVNDFVDFGRIFQVKSERNLIVGHVSTMYFG